MEGCHRGAPGMSCDVTATVALSVPRRRILRTAHAALRALGSDRGGANVSLAFVGDVAMRSLNRRYRRVQGTTDVLSFPGKDDFLGELVISVPQAQRQARRCGHSLAKELDVLIVHGLLHLAGHTHGTAASRARMQRLERRLLAGSSLVHRSTRAA